MTIGAAELRQMLDYDSATGVFRWRYDKAARAKAGTIAGHHRTEGYRVIYIDKTKYWAHRLAWLYVHGRWPGAFLDHINGDRDDNRIANLREATRAQNNRNRPAISGLKGTSRSGGKWVARIRAGGPEIYLGSFGTEEAAHAAYAKASATLHGEFGRTA